MKPKVLLRLPVISLLLIFSLIPSYAVTTKSPGKIGLVFSAQTATQPRQSGVYLAKVSGGEIKTIPLLEKSGVCFCCQFISQDRHVVSCDGNRLFISDLQACRSSSLPPFEKPRLQEVQEAAPGDIYTISPDGHLQLCHLATLRTEAVDFPLEEVTGKPEYARVYYLRLSPDRQKLAFFAAPKKMSEDFSWSLLVLNRAGKLSVLDHGLWRHWGPVSSSIGPSLTWQGSEKICYQNEFRTAEQGWHSESKCADLDGQITLLNNPLPRQKARPSLSESRYIEFHGKDKRVLRDRLANQLVWQGDAALLENYCPSPDGKFLAFLVREKKDSDAFDLWLYDASKKRSQKIFHGEDFSPLRWVKL